MTWSVANSGSKTATGGGTEDTLDTETTANTFVLAVDTVNMALGDVVTLKVYDRIDGTNYRLAWEGTYSNVQVCLAKETPPMAITSAVRFTLTQSAGTGRSFPWVVRSI